MGKIFLEIYFVGSFMVFFSNKEKCGANFSTKFKFFLTASNILKNAFEHSTAEDLVPTARKNRYA